MRKHSTSNTRHPISNERVGGDELGVRCWMLDVGCFGYSWRRIVLAALFALAFLDFSLPAQTPATSDSSSRYLFVVDTSSAMRRRAPAVQKTLGNLLFSSLHAQFRRGDTVGLWTYNEELYAERFALQRWTPETSGIIASNMLAFLEAQRYEKKARLDRVWPALQELVRESEKLTVLLVSDGGRKISGTPFDPQINELWQRDFKAQQKARMPFVTVLRSWRGGIFGCTVNPAPWPVEFPAFLPEPKPVIVAPKNKPPAAKVEMRPTVPPLILIGKKTEPPVAAPSPPTESPVTKLSATATAPPVIAATKETSPLPAAVPTAPLPKPPEHAPALASPTADPKLNLAVADSKPAVVDLPITSVFRGFQTHFSGIPQPTTPPPTAASPHITSPTAAHATADKSEKPETTQKPKIASSNRTLPAAQMATVTEPETILGRTNRLLAGLALLVLAGAIFLLLQRRVQSQAHASLITRSMDQDKK